MLTTFIVEDMELESSERIHSFVLLMSHDRLLTNYNESLKGLGGADCKSCGSVMETTLHALGLS